MTDDHVKINFRLERDSDDYPPQDVESMWAVPVGNDSYRLDNVPFFVRGVSSEDIVRAKREDGVLFFSGLVEAGGHSTVRVLIWNRDEMQVVRDELRAMGCSSEGTNIPGLVAVDIPPSVRYADVREFLMAGEQNGRWEFEEGCIAQPAEN
ncbi:MAG TPA: DUF4265 domain-containing protein [Gemmatimonadaceae bacterium]|nr:DUF4265 domain-containing protein [Gemmatimonadaceae bacterium]